MQSENSPAPPDVDSAVCRLKEQLAKLLEEQHSALERAIYLGMTREETKQQDKRLLRISRLVQQLALLEGTE